LIMVRGRTSLNGMENHTTSRTPVTLLGLGDMGTALGRAWLAAGHPLTVWNRTAAKAAPLAHEGADIAKTARDAVASAAGPIVLCLLDDASVDEVLDGVDPTGRDVVDLTTTTPGQARLRADRVRERGARFLDGGIMAVPPMIGRPETGAFVFYSGDRDLFATHLPVLRAPAGARFVGENPGHAALHDVALLSAMTAMFAGITHAFALARADEDVDLGSFADLLVPWLGAMAGSAHEVAAQLEYGDYTEGVTSNLAMMTTGNEALLATAREQSVDPALLTPFMALMRRRVAQGHGDEGLAGLVDLIRN